jgi:hypothetical protein
MRLSLFIHKQWLYQDKHLTNLEVWSCCRGKIYKHFYVQLNYRGNLYRPDIDASVAKLYTNTAHCLYGEISFKVTVGTA